jgi:hypothetical protein
MSSLDVLSAADAGPMVRCRSRLFLGGNDGQAQSVCQRKLALGDGRFWREADIRQGATRGLGAKFAELVEASALGPGRDAIESKTAPNPCALIISPLHSKQYQIF